MEYRTKMVDWMIEVTTSFKCCPRTYFLAVAIFDKYLIAANKRNKSLANKDIHSVGVISMYIASKFEDVFPLHSKVVSEKIAHGSISQKDIVRMEQEFLQFLDYDVDFVTPFDFHQTYIDKISKKLNANLALDGESSQFSDFCNQMTVPLAQMAMVLVKMAMQCQDFGHYSPSVVVMASVYASTAFLKHSSAYRSEYTTRFCTGVRKIIFDILAEELHEQQTVLSLKREALKALPDTCFTTYMN